MKKETLIYKKLENGKVKCGVCQRRCIISDGKTGWCKTRINERGILYSLIYGEVSSLSVNPIEKKPVFHYYPGSKWLSLGSVGCNFRCPGCQNWNIAHWKNGEMYTEYISPEELVSRAKASGCIGISWTFNEPAIWLEYTLDAAKLAKEQGLYTNYVTNGFISGKALDMISPFLDVYRVDIKAFNKKTILDVAKKAKEHGMHVEIVTNITPGFNDNETELRGIASWIKNSLGPETPWHVTRFHPHFELSHLSPTPIAVLEKAWETGKEEGLWYVYLGNVPGHRLENTYCHTCNELLIERYFFEILKNKIKDNKCPECGTMVPGRF
jgi:pyruvate formate lyase activating enzyme